MKKLQSEVKAAAEKQQTNAHRRESEGERWCASGAETDSERHLAERTSWSHCRKKTTKQPARPPENTQLEYAWSHSVVSWRMKNMEQLGEFDETIWRQSVKKNCIWNKKNIYTQEQVETNLVLTSLGRCFLIQPSHCPMLPPIYRNDHVSNCNKSCNKIQSLLNYKLKICKSPISNYYYKLDIKHGRTIRKSLNVTGEKVKWWKNTVA